MRTLSSAPVSTRSYRPPDEGSPMRMVVYLMPAGQLLDVQTLRPWVVPPGWILELEKPGDAIND